MNSTKNGTDICIIQANPDVTGTGIRASIYALALGGRLLEFLISQLAHPTLYREFKSSIDSALGIQGLALLITAIYQTARHALTLFHAICCIHLLALLGLNVVSKGQYQGLGPRRSLLILTITILSSAAFIALNTYILITAPTFGSQPLCNAQTIYVVFGVSIPATAAVFRYLIIATLAIIPIGILITLTCMVPCFGILWYARRKNPGSVAVTRTPQVNLNENESPRIRAWVQVLGMTAFSVYAIVSLEQTIGRNHVEDEREWTFGQILPLFMLLGVINEAVNLMAGAADRRAKSRGGGTELVPSSA